MRVPSDLLKNKLFTDENYIDAEKFEKIKFKIETCLKKLNAYIKYLKTAKNNQ
jgi:hypothetical protein